MPSVFTQIVNGEIPCHKILEDDQHLAFLDINPIRPGHTLVITKRQFVVRPDDIFQESWYCHQESNLLSESWRGRGWV